MFRHSDLIKMAGFTFGTSCISFNDTAAIYNATGLMFKLYQSQFGNIPLEISGNSPQPKPKFPVGGDQPSTNAGGNTYPLDMVAALTGDREALTIAIVNPTESEQKVSLNLNGLKVGGTVTRWELSGRSVGAKNIVGNPPQVAIHENAIPLTETIQIPPSSINIYRYELL
jgi:alpha-N-arabinofuranosidase